MPDEVVSALRDAIAYWPRAEVQTIAKRLAEITPLTRDNKPDGWCSIDEAIATEHAFNAMCNTVGKLLKSQS
jgi:hypothetical protein